MVFIRHICRKPIGQHGEIYHRYLRLRPWNLRSNALAYYGNMLINIRKKYAFIIDIGNDIHEFFWHSQHCQSLVTYLESAGDDYQFVLLKKALRYFISPFLKVKWLMITMSHNISVAYNFEGGAKLCWWNKCCQILEGKFFYGWKWSILGNEYLCVIALIRMT